MAYFADGFDGPNGTYLSTTPTGGGQWLYYGTAWVYDGGWTYPGAVGSAGAMVDTGESDGVMRVTMSALPGNAGNPGPMFRYVNTTNYWWVDVSAAFGEGNIQKSVNNFFTEVAWFPTDALQHDWRVELAGPLITVYRDNVQVAQVSDSAHQTATMHGFMSGRNAVQDWPTAFDNWSWNEPAPAAEQISGNQRIVRTAFGRGRP